MNLKDHIRTVPDFPIPGILFYDICTLLAHAGAWAYTVDRLAEIVGNHKPDILFGIESRGFLVAAPLALKLGIGFAMVRKKGKLPGDTIAHEYELEYGTDIIEIQDGAVTPGNRVVVVDDLLATGGTLRASLDLLRNSRANVVGTASIIELSFLMGREKLGGVPFDALITYDE